MKKFLNNLLQGSIAGLVVGLVFGLIPVLGGQSLSFGFNVFKFFFLFFFFAGIVAGLQEAVDRNAPTYHKGGAGWFSVG
jgi:hypothetical protein